MHFYKGGIVMVGMTLFRIFLLILLLIAVVLIVILEIRLMILRHLIKKTKSQFRQKSPREIIEEEGVNVHGLKSLGQTTYKKKGSSAVYYCEICYATSDDPGFCHEHGFPNPLTRGSADKLEYYQNKNKLYGSGDEDLTE